MDRSNLYTFLNTLNFISDAVFSTAILRSIAGGNCSFFPDSSLLKICMYSARSALSSIYFAYTPGFKLMPIIPHLVLVSRLMVTSIVWFCGILQNVLVCVFDESALFVADRQAGNENMGSVVSPKLWKHFTQTHHNYVHIFQSASRLDMMKFIIRLIKSM